jgi:hypothetical protein
MDIGSILLIISLLALVALYVSRPLLEGQRSRSVSVDEEEHQVSALLAERDRIVNALKELDFDHAMGKIPEEEYPVQRTALMQKGADILRQLDTFAPAQEEPVSAEERLEAEIAVRRSHLVPAYSGSSSGNTIEDAEDDLEVAIAMRRRGRQEKTGGFCPSCGKPVQANDKFCPKCGSHL